MVASVSNRASLVGFVVTIGFSDFFFMNVSKFIYYYIYNLMFGKLSQFQTHSKSSKPLNIPNNKSLSQQKSDPLIKTEDQHIFHRQDKHKMIKKQNKQKIKRHEHQKGEQKRMTGAKFRILNEILYTNTSEFALEYFKDNQQDYAIYHEGYRSQSEKWEDKPVHQIINQLVLRKASYQHKFIVDLGCGEGFIYEELTKNGFRPKNIQSFDLVSSKPFIQTADISHLPLKSGSVDVAIFCLSLMGVNYIDFIVQAHRILKFNGEMIIAEVESRSQNWQKFIQMINDIGFSLINNGESFPKVNKKEKNQKQSSKYFRIMHFIKNKENSNLQKRIFYKGELHFPKDLSKMLLSGCSYKKR